MIHRGGNRKSTIYKEGQMTDKVAKFEKGQMSVATATVLLTFSLSSPSSSESMAEWGKLVNSCVLPEPDVLWGMSGN